MPELPEVETIRRGLALRISGRQIVRAELRRPDRRRPFPPMLATRLEGARIGALSRRGKYILVELDDTGLLLLHLGMSGRITAAGPELPPEKHDHVILTLDDGTVVRFNDPRRFGLIDYLERGAAGIHPLLAGMGPEPLEPGFDGAYLDRVLAGKLTPIKAALLDQRIVAGLGNIYVCEALYRAGLSPRRLAATVIGARLRPGQWRARLFPAPLGGLWQGGRALLRLHLRRGRPPHRPVRPLDLFLRQAPALAQVKPVTGAAREPAGAAPPWRVSPRPRGLP